MEDEYTGIQGGSLVGKRESEEKRQGTKQTRGTKGILASILFVGSMVCVMLWMMMCGGCKTFGSGGGLPVPGTLSGQGMELKDINGRLYDYLQILLWVGRNNYDDYDCKSDQREGWEPENGKPEMRNYRFGNGLLGNRKPGNHKPKIGSYKFGNGLLGNRRLRNYDNPGSRKPRNHDPRNGDVGNRESELKNKEVGQRALDGCMEIVGLPDGNEMLLANNIDGEGVKRLVREAMVLKARKEKLVGRMGKDVALLEKRCVRYESSHRTLRTLQLFGCLACGIVAVLSLVFFRLR
jgi:hypothetical protein